MPDSALRLAAGAEAFRAARAFLLEHRADYDRAYARFRWPELREFNWALDWFDAIDADRPALRVVDADAGDVTLSFGQL
ncbi:MAG TPA: hypothetical protein VGJ58_02815, partial [Gaiellaceae bacterium]